MISWNVPWLELSIATPLIGALWITRHRPVEVTKRHACVIAGATLLFAIGVWFEFTLLDNRHEHGPFDFFSQLFGSDALRIDQLSAPLFVMAALLYLATILATPQTKIRRFSFAGALVSESLLLATFSCRDPLGLTLLLIASIVPPFFELRARGRSVKLYTAHMAAFAVLLLGGTILTARAAQPQASTLGLGMLIVAVLIRCGIAPLHLWISDLFENAGFGTALLATIPMVGAYAAVRLVLPIAPAWSLRGVALLSLLTAIYAAGMALVQKGTRRFFCYLFLSHASLVLIGLETATPIGLTAALSLMLSIGLALAGLGLTLRAIEARTGRLSLDGFHGMYEHTPMLATFFLLTGLASVGFPGTFGFVGTELLVESAVDAYPTIGILVVLAAALNGIAVVQVYFRIFTGTRRAPSVSLRYRPWERVAVLVLTTVILAGGIHPQPGITSRYHAASELLRGRSNVQPHSVPATAHRASSTGVVGPRVVGRSQ